MSYGKRKKRSLQQLWRMHGKNMFAINGGFKRTQSRPSRIFYKVQKLSSIKIVAQIFSSEK